MTMRKMMLVVLVVCFTISADLEGVQPQLDCYDACSTGCVQPDSRLMRRCDRKCQIRCAPDSEADDNPRRTP